jgi:DNA invertase Pin-like site-specific DNA recombinase
VTTTRTTTSNSTLRARPVSGPSGAGRASSPEGRRAVILARVSTSDKGQTTASQVEALRAAAARLGWQVAEVVEAEQSAWTVASAREVHDRALAPIVAGRADTLMVWAWDRYSREGIEGAFRELRHLEEHLGAAFFSLREPFLSTATADRQQRELMLSIIAWAAKWESERRSERLKARVLEKRTAAGKLGQRARWGRGVSATAAEVARVHELRGAGWTVRTIGAELGLSKSQVSTILRVRSGPDGQTAPTTGEGPLGTGQD